MSRLGYRKGVNCDLEPWTGEGAGEDTKGTSSTQMKKQRQAQLEKAQRVVSGNCRAGDVDVYDELSLNGSSLSRVCSVVLRTGSEDTPL